MILHVLPGDAYVETFRNSGIQGEIAVFREALVDGDVTGDTPSELWANRDRYLTAAYPENETSYHRDVVPELEKILAVREGDDVNLWFEYELFCSVNYWFCLSLLHDTAARVFRITPSVRTEETKWRGFGGLTAEEFVTCSADRFELTRKDIDHGNALWLAFRSGNSERLVTLGVYDSPAFPYLSEVAAAASELDTRPQQILREIAGNGPADLCDVFPEFTRRAGVYGLGDLQVKKLLSKIAAAD
jgi:hypothetical protein